ncbi:PREDICTED: auxin-responsive [Prunus dulcis]|uniref:PREDICTED: auxin-responsive n=1 Tax=Prunus dulcis TaxID=3755 RepID=A0A5E4G9Q5_PRUDU|nr:PREDICTED: auxin-responsive [Prunus dulcis]
MNPASLVQEKIRLFIEKLGKSLSKKHGVVPKGYIDVYLGKERKSYRVPLNYLLYPTFEKLIKKSQTDVLDPKIEGPFMLTSFQKLIEKSQTDVFDPKIKGPLVLRCTADDFHKSLENFKEY